MARPVVMFRAGVVDPVVEHQHRSRLAGDRISRGWGAQESPFTSCRGRVEHVGAGHHRVGPLSRVMSSNSQTQLAWSPGPVPVAVEVLFAVAGARPAGDSTRWISGPSTWVTADQHPRGLQGNVEDGVELEDVEHEVVDAEALSR